MSSILFKEECYRVIGICMEIHKTLGMGLKEINYKDAMQLEFQKNNIPYEREKRFKVTYKGKVLSNPYVADFLVFNSFILEVKSVPAINQTHVAQTLSYLNVSSTKLGIIINFGDKSLGFQRIVF